MIEFTPDTRDLSKCWGDLSKFIYEKVKNSGVDFASSINISQIIRAVTVSREIMARVGNEPLRILDVGCSTATMYGFLKENYLRNANKNLKYHGLEVYTRLIDKANKDFGKDSSFQISKFDGNLESIEKFGEQDVVLMQQFIEHIAYDCALQQIAAASKVLKSDGLFVLSSPNPDKKNGKQFVYPDHHEYEFAYEEIEQILQKNDFEIINTFGWIGYGDLNYSALSDIEKDVFDALSFISKSFAEAITAHLNKDFSSYYLVIAKKK